MMEKPNRLSVLLCGAVLWVGIGAVRTAHAQCVCGGSAIGGYAGDYSMDLPPGVVGQILEVDSIYLTVHVPEMAIIHINGDPTISVGPVRYFVVRGLDPEKEYKFVIVVETANAAGVAMEETKTVTLSPGTHEAVTMKPVKRKVIKAVEIDATIIVDPSPSDGVRDIQPSPRPLQLSAKQRADASPPF